MLRISMVTENSSLSWKIGEVRGGAGVEMWGFGCLHGEVVAFPWTPDKRRLSWRQMCGCLDNYQVFSCLSRKGRWCGLWFQDLLYVVRCQPKDLLVGFSMLGKAQSTCSAPTPRETQNELKVIQWGYICCKKGGRSWISWDSLRLTSASQKTVLTVATFMLTCVSSVRSNAYSAVFFCFLLLLFSFSLAFLSSFFPPPTFLSIYPSVFSPSSSLSFCHVHQFEQ